MFRSIGLIKKPYKRISTVWLESEVRSVMEAPLKHPGTGRCARVLRVDRFESAQPVAVAAENYVLLVASERLTSACTEEHVRAWVEAGASYICAWGPASGVIEEAFDYASFLPSLGEPLSFTLMTTSHKDDLEEALWFAFYCAVPPDDLPGELNTVVVVVDSPALENACRIWVQKNAE